MLVNLLLSILQMNFPYKNCNPYKDKLDVYLLKELKETFCHLNQVNREFVLLVLT